MLRVCGMFMTAGLLFSCAPQPSQPTETVLYVYRSEPAAFIELDHELTPRLEIPFAMPEGCGMGGVTAAPRGPQLAVELACPFGPAVLLLDVETRQVQQPVRTSDSHLLAWAPEGDALYLRLGVISKPRVVRLELDGTQRELGIPESTYDLALSPRGDRLVYSYSKGMGLGSEIWLWSAISGPASERRLTADPRAYIGLARWSPDEQRIAFIKIPDSPTPFTVGEIWVMDADGANARFLAEADAGHGFAPAWSPAGSMLAFIVRENPEEPAADTDAGALESNLFAVNVDAGEVHRLTDLPQARVESAVWQPGGRLVAFDAITDDKMAVFLQDALSGELRQIPLEGVCCAAWLRR